MEKWVIFDLDGTLADHNHRLHLAKDKKWDDYFEAASKDKVNKIEVLLLEMFLQNKVKICILTGRPERFRIKTRLWLMENFIHYHQLIMRDNEDFRPSARIKKEWIENNFNFPDEPHKNLYALSKELLCIVVDRPSIIEMARAMGITAIQTQPGVEF